MPFFNQKIFTVGACLLTGTSVGFGTDLPYHVSPPSMETLDRIRDNCATEFTPQNINELREKGSTYVVQKNSNGLYTLYQGRDNLPGKFFLGTRQAKAAEGITFLTSKIEPIDGKESLICTYKYKQKTIRLSVARNTIGLPERRADLTQRP